MLLLPIEQVSIGIYLSLLTLRWPVAHSLASMPKSHRLSEMAEVQAEGQLNCETEGHQVQGNYYPDRWSHPQGRSRGLKAVS